MSTSGKLRASKVNSEKWTKNCFDNAKIMKTFRRKVCFKTMRFSENCLTKSVNQ